jgi:hypothetical protein
MLEGFDPSTVSGNPVYQCGVCENNTSLAANGRSLIAIGLLADEADRTQLRTIRWNPMATAQESRSDASETRLRRGFPISPLVCGEISSNRPWYRS